MLFMILFLLSFSMTGLVRYYALQHNVMDTPNYRSSHTVPTPRGGGVAFVFFFLISLLYLVYCTEVSFWEAVGFFVAGMGIATLGFMDDHRPIPAKWRLLVHFIASGFALYCLGGMTMLLPSNLSISGAELLINVVALVYLVWILNLYNFMDGINGLAAIETITVCIGGALIYGLQGYSEMMWLPLILAVVVAGFLFWNFPVARIFMGDVGSGFLGLMIGLFSIQAALVNHAFFWAWLILSGVFIVDATLTLLTRMVNGCRIAEPHRQHAYQRAVDMFGSHVKVSSAVLVINVIWLLPIAVLVGCGYLHGVTGLLIAYAPLGVLVFQFGWISSVNVSNTRCSSF